MTTWKPDQNIVFFAKGSATVNNVINIITTYDNVALVSLKVRIANAMKQVRSTFVKGTD